MVGNEGPGGPGGNAGGNLAPVYEDRDGTLIAYTSNPSPAFQRDTTAVRDSHTPAFAPVTDIGQAPKAPDKGDKASDSGVTPARSDVTRDSNSG